MARDTVYVIRTVTCRITGKTKEWALVRELGFGEESFTSTEALDAYIARKTQDLHNLRALDAGAGFIRYTLGEAEPDGTVPVHVEVYAADSLNFIILPEPKYDSNTGFSLSLKAREYNFLGTLSPLKFDLIWERDDKKNLQSVGFLIDTDLPFEAFGFVWNINFDNEYRYFFGAPWYYKNTTGLSMELPVSSTLFTFGFEQGLVFHEENDTDDDINDGEYHDWYAYSKLYTDWKIPTPLEAGPLGRVSYIPGVYVNVNYQPGGDVGDYRRGPNGGFNHRLEAGTVDWLGNFRQGFKASVFNNNDWNFFHHDRDNSIGLLAEGHVNLSRRFGISGRFGYTHWFDDSFDLAGDVIRGLEDDALDAGRRLFLNLDFPFRLIRFTPSEWSGKKKLRYFDFEQHWSPFIDLVMVESAEGYSFHPRDIITSVGLEVITFPLTWRSFYIRISAGWNMREWLKNQKPPSGIYREIFIGLGHFY
ncbi:MAG: hypothetical protein LBK77_07290 [Spirochaetaceae bacterium]|jgi:hypothetical protein|nr:hypothetical protein [Spirochaetaceae bacterium]